MPDISTLSLWGKGSVTLPKRWRDRYPTKLFLAEVTRNGYLLIKPVLQEDIIYYEEEDRVGLHFPHGMPMKTFVEKLRKANAKITKEEHARTRNKKRHA